jgi:hypothetical protein
MTASAMDYMNAGLGSMVANLQLGFIRWSAGTPSDAYDWDSTLASGPFPSAWAHSFSPTSAWVPVCLLDPRNPSCTAGWGSYAFYTEYNTIHAHKSNAMNWSAWNVFRQNAGVKTVVSVNVFTDTVASLTNLANAIKAAGVTPTLWELGNETWGKTSWQAPSGTQWTAGQTPFSDGLTYAKNVKQFADAIHAVFPTAHIGLEGSANGAWDQKIADYTTSTATGGNCAGASSSKPCTFTNFPPYFDTVVIHPYPCQFDMNTEAQYSCMNEALWQWASTLPKQIHDRPGCGIGDPQPTSSPTCTTWESGFNVKVDYTEINSDLEGGDSAQIIVPGGHVRGTVYNALYLAEFAARAASAAAALPYTNHVGVQGLYGNYWGLVNSTQEPTFRADLQTGPISANGGVTTTADYGLFYNPEGLAMMIVDGAINPSTQNVAVTFTAPGAPQVTVCTGDCNGACCNGVTHTSNGVKAYAWRDSASPHNYHVLLTNRTGTPYGVTPGVDGNDTLAQAPTITSISGSSPSDYNSTVTSTGVTTDTSSTTGVTLQQCSGSTTNGYLLPPYSVARLDWAQ